MGVEVGTERLWKRSEELGLARLVLVNLPGAAVASICAALPELERLVLELHYDQGLLPGVPPAQGELDDAIAACRARTGGALVGQAMKATKGKANPSQVNQILKKKLAP